MAINSPPGKCIIPRLPSAKAGKRKKNISRRWPSIHAQGSASKPAYPQSEPEKKKLNKNMHTLTAKTG